MTSLWPSKRLLQYEIRNISGNPYTIFFGIAFPIIMSALISFVFLKEVPEELRSKAMTGVFLMLSLIISMAVLLIGYAANYSQEIEKEVPLRLKLFGFSERSILLAKMLAHLLFITGAFIIYVIAEILILDLQVPAFRSVLILIGCLYLLSVILFVLAHGIATLCKKFGKTYAITMFLYFIFMILCGMMGISVDQYPPFLQRIARMFPMTYISSDFVDFWQGGTYNFVPMIQSYLFFGAVASIVLFLAIRNKHKA